MIEELQWLRPFQMRGDDDHNGGHAWVVYGYNKLPNTTQFKMNMGWGGEGDNWYSCDLIDCLDGNSDPGSDGVPDFADDQMVLLWIAPRDGVRFVGGDVPGDGSPLQPYEDIEEAMGSAADGSTLIFRAGSENTFSADTLVITRPFTLRGEDVTVRGE